jgi:predicted nucleotidyltransferase
VTDRLHIVSTSAASDGSFMAISEIGAVLKGEQHRLIGGVAILLHQHRLGIDHPIRATADADFGIPPYALKDDSLVDAVAACGYRRVRGNRWTRPIDSIREATVDLLVPGYQTRQRASVQHGSTNTTEVGGLAEALRRPSVEAIGQVTLTDGVVLDLDLLIPDVASMLGLKLHARRVRDEDRDAVDLWTCMELLAAAGEISEFGSRDFDEVRRQLPVEFADAGRSMSTITGGVTEEEAASRRTRIRGLVRAIGG